MQCFVVHCFSFVRFWCNCLSFDLRLLTSVGVFKLFKIKSCSIVDIINENRNLLGADIHREHIVREYADVHTVISLICNTI